MEDFEMAAAIAFELDSEPWSAKYAGLDEIYLTNENGEKFVVQVRKVDAFPE